MSEGLSIRGRVTVTLEGHEMKLVGEGKQITLDVPSRSALWSLLRHVPKLPKPDDSSSTSRDQPPPEPIATDAESSSGSDAKNAWQLAETEEVKAVGAAADPMRELVDRIGLELIVRVSEREVARLGGGVKPTWLSKLLGTGPLQVKPAAIWALIRG